MAYTSKMTTKKDVDKMVDALKKAGAPIQEHTAGGGYFLMLDGKKVFSALKGAHGKWLVKHVDTLFA